MKRKLSLLTACLLLLLLCACQGKTVTETHWAAAKKAGGLEDYVKGQAENIDMEALRQEAQEDDLEQQFKATALLCALEYRQDLADESTPTVSRFRFSYPVGSEYATRFLSQVNTDSEAFWASMNDAFSPYDCFLPIFAAAKELDGPTLAGLLAGDPPGKTQFKEAIDQWVEQNPGKIVAVGDDLAKAGYFDKWAISKWSSTFLHPTTNSYRIQTDTVEDAFGYVSYLRDVMLPPLVEKNGTGSLVKPSEITGEDYFSSSVMIAVNNDSLTLQEPSDSGLPETIELEGKTVAAFYYNPGTGEFDDQLPSLQLMGGFLLALPEEEAPATPAEADYYLVLTAHFERGDFYKGANGKDTGTQQVNSLTSVDLYDAATGAFLRHLGNLRELAPDTVYTSYDDTSLQYPVPTKSDVLLYMYHNINDPGAYISLVDNTPVSGSTVEPGQPVQFGGWEITYHSARIVSEFEYGMYVFSADEGKQCVIADLTVANRGLNSDTFLPVVYYPNEDPTLYVTDSGKENRYDCVNVMMYSPCLNSKTVEPGGSKDGELVFQIPDSLAQSGEQLYIAVTLGRQVVYYPLR